MHELWPLAMAFGFGIVLGLLYFAGLWKTVMLLPALRWAPVWMLLSLMLRLGLLLAGLYWVGDADWQRFVAALAGILLVRLLLTRWLGQLNPLQAAATKRGGE